VQELAAYGADRVVILHYAHGGPVWSRAVSQALADAIHAAQPYAVFFAATADGRVLATRVAARLRLGLTEAQVVLGVGMGLGGPEHLPTVQSLAHTLGAALATTRNVVHAGWLPHHIQVGISGRAIAPRVYLAVGIRGAFNHTVGIQKAGIIIALNQNPRAAIFKAADYGIVGAWQTYLPPLVEALQPVVAALR
jgi:electron transfer flavoprotein alpha subunit